MIALGRRLPAYITQKRDGSIREERIPVMAEVAMFCRERLAVCHHVGRFRRCGAVLDRGPLSQEQRALSRDLARINGVCRPWWRVNSRSRSWANIISPVRWLSTADRGAEWEFLEPAFKAEMLAYVEAGGNCF